ncbi:hypothetical protein DGo_PB0151 (plasmid) [Deinococcus gobiensis I-0]|uniref:Uncharacterized protein n=1 Tax=Deinococcus gobiensis (strain DSM 21396 / JCM 16679 / CGMCC 1.7299 / I-0) TaxID=745776 RepID=H8H1M3_DEIGI|nr:hypothetical protein DGo_PB0151 [Deinococcus gobiensis I-0]
MVKVYVYGTHIPSDIPTHELGPFLTEQEARDAVAQLEGKPFAWERTKWGFMTSSRTTRWVTEVRAHLPMDKR